MLKILFYKKKIHKCITLLKTPHKDDFFFYIKWKHRRFLWPSVPFCTSVQNRHGTRNTRNVLILKRTATGSKRVQSRSNSDPQNDLMSRKTNPVTVTQVEYLSTVTKDPRPNGKQNVLVSILSLALQKVHGNMPTVGILALGLVYLFSPLSACPLQVCLSSFAEPRVWIHSSHAIWCQQAPSATLIHSRNSPRSVSRGSDLNEGQVSHKVVLKTTERREKSPHKTMSPSDTLIYFFKGKKTEWGKNKTSFFYFLKGGMCQTQSRGE